MSEIPDDVTLVQYIWDDVTLLEELKVYAKTKYICDVVTLLQYICDDVTLLDKVT
jgi:hypothetical protein